MYNVVLHIERKMKNHRMFGCRLQVYCECLKVVGSSDPATTRVLQPKTIIHSGIRALPRTFEKRVLHQKYVLERHSMRQIADAFASSKTAVRSALLRFGIPIRDAGSSPHRTHNLPFGKKCVNGRVEAHKGERRTIESIVRMHGEGMSNCAIARVLTEIKIQTKQRGKAWHPEMVRQILIREK